MAVVDDGMVTPIETGHGYGTRMSACEFCPYRTISYQDILTVDTVLCPVLDHFGISQSTVCQDVGCYHTHNGM